MIISTLTTYPGKIVSQDLGIITGFDSKLRPFRLNVDLQTYIEEALKELEKEATKLEAHGVLGVQFMMDDKKIPIAIGTAVKFTD